MTNTAVASSSTTYLERCVQDSSPGNISSLEWKSALWRTAAVATYVAYTALTMGAIAATILYVPVYVPLVAIGSLLAMSLVNMAYKKFDGKAENAQFDLKNLKAISKHEQELAPLTPQQVQTNLVRKGIHWYTIPGMVRNPAALETLKPLIARHAYYEENREKCEKEMKTALEKVAKLTAENKPETLDEIPNLNLNYLFYERAALKAKVSAAFMSAVIQRPGYTGKFKDIGSFSIASPLDRALDRAINPAAVTDFFLFKSTSLPKLTYDEVKRISVPELSTRLIAAMPA